MINLRAESHESLDRAILFLERAVALDPAYAQAHLKLGLRLRHQGLLPGHARAVRARDRPVPARHRAAARRSCPPGASWAASLVALVPRGRGDRGRSGTPWPWTPRTPARTPRWAARTSSAAATSAAPRSATRRPSPSTRRRAGTPLQLAHCCALLRRVRARRGRGAPRGRAAGGLPVRPRGLPDRGRAHAPRPPGRAAGPARGGARALPAGARLPAARGPRAAEPHPHRAAPAAGQRAPAAGRRRRGRAPRSDRALEGFERRLRLGADDPFSRYYAACALRAARRRWTRARRTSSARSACAGASRSRGPASSRSSTRCAASAGSRTWSGTRRPSVTAPVPLSVLDLSPIVAGGDAATALRNTLDLARHAERLGYRRFWLAEHHNMPGIASAATSVVIGHVAGGTSTIRVGAGGIMLPEPFAARDRGAVRHAGVALPRPHRPRRRARAGHRPRHRRAPCAAGTSTRRTSSRRTSRS